MKPGSPTHHANTYIDKTTESEHVVAIRSTRPAFAIRTVVAHTCTHTHTDTHEPDFIIDSSWPERPESSKIYAFSWLQPPLMILFTYIAVRLKTSLVIATGHTSTRCLFFLLMLLLTSHAISLDKLLLVR